MDKNIKNNRKNIDFDEEFSAADHLDPFTGEKLSRIPDEEVEKAFGRRCYEQYYILYGRIFGAQGDDSSRQV